MPCQGCIVYTLKMMHHESQEPPNIRSAPQSLDIFQIPNLPPDLPKALPLPLPLTTLLLTCVR